MKEVIQKAIELAILGGYSNVEIDANPERNIMWKVGMTDIPDVFLQPLFWQALGKSLGWGEGQDFAGSRNAIQYGSWITEHSWGWYWHSFIDHLAEGKDPEEFFKELIK